MIVSGCGLSMSEQEAKKHLFRVAYLHSPATSDEVIAKALGRDVRTIQRWRRELREQAIKVKSDTCHCLKILDRA